MMVVATLLLVQVSKLKSEPHRQWLRIERQGKLVVGITREMVPQALVVSHLIELAQILLGVTQALVPTGPVLLYSVTGLRMRSYRNEHYKRKIF